MKLIVGLGNPGEKYVNNRHNVGFMTVDRLQSTVYSNTNWEDNSKFDAVVCSLKSVDTLLVKPQTFMNDSGWSVGKIVNWYKIPPDDVYVIYDDLDICLGEYKTQKGKGPKVHNGVKSVDKALDNRQYWHVRIGVDNRSPENRIPGEQYVLQDFSEDELRIVGVVLSKVTEELKDLTHFSAMA